MSEPEFTLIHHEENNLPCCDTDGPEKEKEEKVNPEEEEEKVNPEEKEEEEESEEDSKEEESEEYEDSSEEEDEKKEKITTISTTFDELSSALRDTIISDFTNQFFYGFIVYAVSLGLFLFSILMYSLDHDQLSLWIFWVSLQPFILVIMHVIIYQLMCKFESWKGVFLMGYILSIFVHVTTLVVLLIQGTPLIFYTSFYNYPDPLTWCVALALYTCLAIGTVGIFEFVRRIKISVT